MRKKILISFLLILCSTSSFAKSKLDENEESCRGLMAVAKIAISARQDGTPLESMLMANDMLRKKGEMSKSASEAFRKVLIDAYDQPTYSSVEYQQKAISDFSAKYYVNCMKGYGLN